MSKERIQERERFNKALLAAASVCAMITLIIYLPSLKNDFVNWDDPAYVYENASIRAIDLRFLKTIFTTAMVVNWHPLTMLSLAVDYKFWGLNPLGYHLTNIVFHAINTFLVFILSVRLMESAGPQTASPGQNPSRAGYSLLITGVTSALLFGLHPLHVESVTWISARKDLLSTFFIILSVLAYLGYAERKKAALNYAASLLFFTLALMSKPIAVTLPLALLILDYYPLGRFSLKRIPGLISEKAPFFALSVILGFLTVWAQKKGGALMPLEEFSPLGRVLIMARGFIFYLYKMILPLDLHPFYPLPTSSELYSSITVLAVLIFASVTAFSLITIKRNRIIPAVWFYYLVTLLPVIGIVKAGYQFAADRYTYLPGIGFFILLGAAAAYVYGRSAVARKAVVAVVVTAAVLLGGLTVRQEAVWKDTITMWTRTIEKYRGRVPMGYCNRGLAYEKMRDYPKAIDDYNRAIENYPRFVEAYLNRGIAFGETGEYMRAIKDFNTAIELSPGSYNAYLNRGVAYLSVGEYEKAAADFKVSIEFEPENPVAYYNMGLVYARLGDMAKEDFYFKKASDLGLQGR